MQKQRQSLKQVKVLVCLIIDLYLSYHASLTYLLERIVYNRLYKYIYKNNILYNKQFGFQKHHSTDHAILQLFDQISDSFENYKFTVSVLIDLSKAFDTVDHNILLEKLIYYGITGTNLNWFSSYLTNRKQNCFI